MIKVLKSFKSAHEAVDWISRNGIEDASIEMTGTLKSIGYSGPIPSGNYHVVLKTTLGKSGVNISELIAQVPQNLSPDFKNISRKEIIARKMGVKTPYERSQDAANAVYDAAEAEGIEPVDSEIYDAEGAAYHSRGEKIDAITNALLARERQANEGVVMDSISREDLVNIITKSVIEVLKGGVARQIQNPDDLNRLVNEPARIALMEKGQIPNEDAASTIQARREALARAAGINPTAVPSSLAGGKVTRDMLKLGDSTPVAAQQRGDYIAKIGQNRRNRRLDELYEGIYDRVNE
jgi:hypothetical protein